MILVHLFLFFLPSLIIGFLEEDDTRKQQSSNQGILKLCQYCPAQAIFANRYQLIRLLGTGNFSQVFLVKDLFIPSIIRVVKLLQRNFAILGHSEATWLHRLQCQDDNGRIGVLKFYGMFNHDDHLGLVLEYLEPISKNLFTSEHWLRRLIVDIVLLLDILNRDPLSGLHADIKLENIMYSRDWERFRLIDFGNCVPICELNEYKETFDIQSWFYRAPEVLFGMEISTSIDIWSLGIVLIQLITGRLPFQNTNRNEILNEIAEVLGPFPEAFSQGLFYSNDLPLRNAFSHQDPFWFRWKKSNLARLIKMTNPLFIDLLASMLECDPKKRINTRGILSHPFLAPLIPVPLVSVGSVPAELVPVALARHSPITATTATTSEHDVQFKKIMENMFPF